MHDLQGLQASLESMEVMLRIVLEGIGEDCTHKHSSTCQKLIGEMECAVTIVAVLQARMVIERLRASMEQIQKAKKLDEWKDLHNATQEEQKWSWSSVVRDGYSTPVGAQTHPAK